VKKYKIVKSKLDGKHIQIPQRGSGVFNLSAPAFKLYVWLTSHNDGFSFNADFMVAGVKMHHVTVKKALSELHRCGAIKYVNSDIVIVTCDIKVDKLKNKRKSQMKNVTTDISNLEVNHIESVTSDING